VIGDFVTILKIGAIKICNFIFLGYNAYYVVFKLLDNVLQGLYVYGMRPIYTPDRAACCAVIECPPPETYT
jgi:hypothetical protein